MTMFVEGLAPAGSELVGLELDAESYKRREADLLAFINNLPVTAEAIELGEEQIGRDRIRYEICHCLWRGVVGEASQPLGPLVDYEGESNWRGMAVSFSTQEPEGIVWHHVGPLINQDNLEVRQKLSEPVISLLGKTLLERAKGGVAVQRPWLGVL